LSSFMFPFLPFRCESEMKRQLACSDGFILPSLRVPFFEGTLKE
jgi:hypothetical protein